jgi:hypothetical protein
MEATSMIQRISWTPALLALCAAALLHSAPAVAERVDFCDPSTANCVRVDVMNQSAATVTSVKIRQTPDNGCAEVTKREKANLGSKDKFEVAALDKCAYHFMFNTTKGCTGTKDIKVSAKDLQTSEVWVVLTGACGTLNTKLSSGYE